MNVAAKQPHTFYVGDRHRQPIWLSLSLLFGVSAIFYFTRADLALDQDADDDDQNGQRRDLIEFHAPCRPP